MQNLEKAILLEKETFPEEIDYKVLETIILDCGFDNLTQYFDTKREYLFSNWIPEIYHIEIADYAAVTEDAILNSKYGIYISYGEGIHAYHGSDKIDRELCEKLGVRIVDLNYSGGTIIGSENDLSIIMVFPKEMSMCHPVIIKKVAEIIGKYVPNITIHGNDILMNGDKISGSMTRVVNDSFVWAAQISFNDYSDLITQICQKPHYKKPNYIDSKLLTRDILENEIISWLCKYN